MTAVGALDVLQSAASRLYPQAVYGCRGSRVQLLATAGRLSEATAAVVALKADVERADTNLRQCYLWGQGFIAFVRGDYPEAVRQLERAKAASGSIGGWPTLGRAYLKAGRLDLAIAELEKATSVIYWDGEDDPFIRVTSHYYLAQAYEQSGGKAKTIEQYTTFLDIWKDADRELPEITDARAWLTRLQS